MTRKKVKRIGILTSGGDAPGMNPCIRAVVRTALKEGLSVVGIKHGYEGLVSGEMEEMHWRSVSNIIKDGGTVLGTGRSRDFLTERGQRRAWENLKKANVDALVVMGGDGTFRGAYEFGERFGVKIVGIPATIDNDVAGTDYTIGFDTAVNTALEAIDRIRDTATSFERIFYVEVMGRLSGYIALYSALAGGAEEVLIPETRTDIKKLTELILNSLKAGKRSILIIVAEGDDIGGAFEIARKVRLKVDADYRVCVLGHIQRGGSPTAADRILATKLGYYAVQAVKEGRFGVAVGEVKGKIVYTPFAKLLKQTKALDPFLQHLVETLGA